MEDMGRPESTGTFEARLDQALQEATAVDAKMKDHIHTINAADAVADKDVEEVTAQEEEKDAEDEEWSIKFAGCYLDEAAQQEDRLDTTEPWQMRAEMILARKVHKDQLYYKVLWRQRNIISWELEENVDDKQKIFDFEKLYKERYANRGWKTRPVTYVTRRQLAHTAKTDPATAIRIEDSKKGKGIWSCEVEPMIWIPYDDAAQRRLEDAFGRGGKSATIFLAGREYSICFENLRQNLGTAVPDNKTVGRKVQRVIQLPEDEERKKMMAMSLAELREHIGSIQEFQSVHYEMLGRLHELDKVVTHASTQQLETLLHHTTFENILNQITEGAEFPGFSMECFICLEDYKGADEVSVLPGCGHFYHKKCGCDYFKQYSKLCPVCKVAIC